MSTPTDSSYSAAVKWSQQNQGTARGQNSEVSYWIILVLVISVIIICYVWLLRSSNPKVIPSGALSALNPRLQQIPLILDNMGRIQVK